MSPECSIAVGLDGHDERWRFWTRMRDVRPGFVPIAGQYAIVGCEDADPAVARIMTADIERGIQPEVLDGDVEEHGIF